MIPLRLRDKATKALEVSADMTSYKLAHQEVGLKASSIFSAGHEGKAWGAQRLSSRARGQVGAKSFQGRFHRKDPSKEGPTPDRD